MIDIKYYNNNYIEIETLDSELYKKLKKYYTFEINKFAARNGPTWMKNSKPTICLIKKNRFLPYGLLDNLINYLIFNDYKFNISKNLVKNNNISEKTLLRFIDELNLPFAPYDHQIDGILKSIEKCRLILRSATSSGKSLILYILCILFTTLSKPHEKILLIVPNVQLVGQMFEDFCEYSQNNDKINIYKFVKMFHGGTNKIFDKKILISTFQTLIKQKSEFFEQFKYVFVDECHTAKCKSIMTIMNNCINANYRIGMTGSLYNKNEMLNNMTIMGLLGPIYKVIDAKELIDKKLASPINIKLELIKWGDVPYDYNIENEVKSIKESKHMNNDEKRKKIKAIKEDLYRKERIKIFNNKERFKIIYNLLKKEINNNVLIVFSEQYYGKKLKSDINKIFKDKNIFHVDGTVKNDNRDKLVKSMENSNNNIGIVSVGTFKQGISIKNLHYIIFAQVGKAQISLVQLLGRGMRLHDSKDEIVIYDIVDKLSYVNEYGKFVKKGYMQKHSEERIKIYKSEKHPYKINSTHNID